jgi:ribosomal protein S25
MSQSLKKQLKKSTDHQLSKTQKSKWNKEKEKEHLKQTRAFYEKVGKNQEKAEKETRDGFMVSKRFLSSGSKRSCETCGKYSFSFQDDVYFTKFGCCFELLHPIC